MQLTISQIKDENQKKWIVNVDGVVHEVDDIDLQVPCYFNSKAGKIECKAKTISVSVRKNIKKMTIL